MTGGLTSPRNSAKILQRHCSATKSAAQPRLTMVVVLLRISVKPPQKAAPHTARYNVQSVGLARRYEIASGGSHAGILLARGGDSTQINLSWGSGKS